MRIFADDDPDREVVVVSLASFLIPVLSKQGVVCYIVRFEPHTMPPVLREVVVHLGLSFALTRNAREQRPAAPDLRFEVTGVAAPGPQRFRS
jgi:hypothetical protein